MRKIRVVWIVLACLCLLGSGHAAAQELFHGAYLAGFPDGSLRPEACVTRAELAQILCRMLPEETRRRAGDSESAFRDVPAQAWYEPAVCVMARLGLMLGGPDGRFRPEDGVTGEELSIILERIRAGAQKEGLLSALAGGWQAQEVSFAAGNGWVMGLHDGVFSPDKAITRAELAEIFNRILGREPEKLEDLLIGMPLFSDNLDTNAAYFLALQEAAIDHTADCSGTSERWTALG